ncbi:universal stress protein [Roseovarius aestuariivivens]|uniref:universal stress protein n=1 Tax=Roseovarius aestuariivivens TaxID=1888910 RepID=UPI001081D5E7|nr:universal stress protein [Roseovarius aestuariivivens]
MAWKSLFCALSDPALVQPTLETAMAMGSRLDAHLDVMALGVNRTPTDMYFAGASAISVQSTLDQCTEEAEAIAKAAREALSALPDLAWSCEPHVAHMADLGRVVAARARFCDAAIQPTPYGEGRGAEMEPLTESILFEGRAPTLILPAGMSGMHTPRQVMVAWNESPEALTAIRAALPLLKEADRVKVVVVDPPAHEPGRSDPGGALSQFLVRHGLRVEIDILSKSLPRVADVLIRHSRDTDADMIVMGAYGHSRFREAVFGGASRAMLEQCPLPLLMAH